jgi:hypothetical protein
MSTNKQVGFVTKQEVMDAYRAYRDAIIASKRQGLDVTSDMPVLKQLYLDLHVARTVPNAFPPQPRLVGVELNPGPPKRGNPDTIREAAAATGVLLSNLLGKKKKKKPKQTKARAALFGSIKPHVKITDGNPPVSKAVQIRSTVSDRPRRCEPFDVAAVSLCTNAGGNPVWGAVASTTFNLPMDINTTAGGVSVFGSAISSISGLYRRYRFKSLVAEYCPLVPTSTAGSFAFAAVGDGAISTVTQFTDTSIGSCDQAVTTPSWMRATIDCRHINRDWLWVQDGTSTTSEERQTCAGVIVCNLATAAAVSTIFGKLRLTGEIELDDFTPVLTLVPTAHFSQKDDEEAKELEHSVYIDSKTASKFRDLFTK